MTYKRGDIVWVKFPFTDLTNAKIRPALIISNDTVNATSDYILVQITSKVKSDFSSIHIANTDYSEGPLLVDSTVRVHKIFTLNDSLIAAKETAVTDSFITHIVNKLNTLI